MHGGAEIVMHTLFFRKTFCEFCQFFHVIKKDKGYIVAFSFGKGAYEEVVSVKQEGLFIELLTVDELLEYEEPASQGKIFLN